MRIAGQKLTTLGLRTKNAILSASFVRGDTARYRTGVPGGLIVALFIATFVLLAVQAAVGKGLTLSKPWRQQPLTFIVLLRCAMPVV